ncbi:hypothetical protein [Phytomonospora endophytica]|uniref:Uncharacterized protein n=1 Tax=Phytomonospora endophytica TaxID=714109 RepID=A0A841FT97_9ACTN|nr:hypothetical protein [Phytomonospora endophytica]MBB6039525.1 hypothetical protein [Phytomonospora endophytica]GIG70489.1 hypothetical protein Pen01_67840 [Phytomonospora endophytica]
MSTIDELTGLIQTTEDRITDAISAANAAIEAGEGLLSTFQGAGDSGSFGRARTVMDGIDELTGKLVGLQTDSGDLRAAADSIRE